MSLLHSKPLQTFIKGKFTTSLSNSILGIYLFSFAVVTDYNKPNSLKQHSFIISVFIDLRSGIMWLDPLCRVSPGENQGIGQDCDTHLGSSSKAHWWLAEVSSSQLLDWGLHFLHTQSLIFKPTIVDQVLLMLQISLTSATSLNYSSAFLFCLSGLMWSH